MLFGLGGVLIVVGVTGIILTGYGPSWFRRSVGKLAEYAIGIGGMLILGSGLML